MARRRHQPAAWGLGFRSLQLRTVILIGAMLVLLPGLLLTLDYHTLRARHQAQLRQRLAEQARTLQMILRSSGRQLERLTSQVAVSIHAPPAAPAGSAESSETWLSPPDPFTGIESVLLLSPAAPVLARWQVTTTPPPRPQLLR